MDINSLLSAIEHSSLLGYLIIFLIFFLESVAFIGLVIPGTVFLVLAGFLASRNVLDLRTLLWLIFAGAIFGDLLSFYLGRKGKKLFKKDNLIFKSFYVEKGEDFFRRHGNKSIIIGRFIGPIRPLVSFVSGLCRVNKNKFFLLNLLSALLWVATYFAVGYFFGQAFQAIEFFSTRISFFLIAIIIFFFVLYLIKIFIVKKGTAMALFFKSIFSSIKEAILSNEDVKKMIDNYPNLFRFLKRRFDRRKFTGMPLTILLIAFAYIFFLFIGVIEDVLSSDLIVQSDMRVVSLLRIFRHPFLVKIFLWITMLGKFKVIIIFALVFSIILWIWRKRFYIIPFWITISGSALFSFLGKLAFKRPRPEGGFYIESSFSFPSGHATMAAAFYFFLIYFFWKSFKSLRAKINLSFLAFIIVILVGFSRLYLGVHYLSDVWAGFLLGILWLIIGVIVGEWLNYKFCLGYPDIFSNLKFWKFDLKKAANYVCLNESGYKLTKKENYLIIILMISCLSFYSFSVLSFKPLYAVDKPIEIKRIEFPLEIFSKDKLPRYSETLNGTPQEPLSFIIIAGSKEDIIDRFRKSGWYLADQVDFNSLQKTAVASLLNESYPEAPMTPSFWNYQVHDLGFEKPTEKDSVRVRHHIRLWNSLYETEDGKVIFLGTASLDTGMKWGITHKINPDVDTEREYIFNDLKNSSSISSYKKEKFVNPVLGKNFTGDEFFTDGEIYILNLK